MDRQLNRTKVIKDLSLLYFKFLKSIDWDDKIYLKGINEGRNKFLSNTYLNLCTGKHAITNFRSKKALEIIQDSNNNSKNGKLIFEHMVPKEKYIQRPSEEIVRDLRLTESEKLDKIFELLIKYWHIASITVEEDKSIKNKRTMPKDWDGVSITARYDEVGITVIKNELWIIK